MSYSPGDRVRLRFPTTSDGQTLADPDAGAVPAVKFVHDGTTDNSTPAAVTVTRQALGTWLADGTIPVTYAVGTGVQLEAQPYVVGGVTSVPSLKDLGRLVASGGGGGGGGAVDLTQAYAGVFAAGTLGSLVQKVASSYGALRTVVVVDGSMAQSRVITVGPADGEPVLPTTGMVRNPPLRIAVTSGGQAVQKAQVVGWRVASPGTNIIVTLNQPWPGTLAAGDLLIVY